MKFRLTLAFIVEKLRLAKAVKADSGKPILSQFFDILRLHFSFHKLGLEEYYELGLYRKHLTHRDKCEFVGVKKQSHYGKLLNDNRWNVVTSDKLIAHSVFIGLKLPIPELRCVYQPYGRSIDGIKCISRPEDLKTYLREDAIYPFFSKPAHGASGRLTIACTAYDATTDSLLLANNDHLLLSDFVESCFPKRDVFPWEAGYLFQEQLQPDREWRKHFGNIAPGLRVVMLNPDGKPKMFRAVLKIPVGSSMIDNFNYGETGNIIADLDVSSGEIVKAYRGTPGRMIEIESHPDTNSLLKDYKVPNWDHYLELMRYSSSFFSGLRLQHWDISISDSGPKILELNTFGGFGIIQLASQRGFCDYAFRSFLDELGAKYPKYTTSIPKALR